MIQDEVFMHEALKEAEAAFLAGEMPVGCVVARQGEIIARAHNECETRKDATAHAELLTLQRAAQVVGDWRLNDCILYVTLEPCPMCAGAIMQSRVGRLVFGASDPAQGCAGSKYRITEDPAFPNFCPADGGVLAEECSQVLKRFFAEKRKR